MIPLIFAWLLASADIPEGFAVSLQPPAPVQGQLFVVELSGIGAQDKAGGLFGERALRFFLDASGRVRALAVVPLDQAAGAVSLQVTVERPDQAPITQGIPVKVGAGKFGRQVLTVDPKFVTPPARELARIEREQRQFDKLWKAPPTPRQWNGSFARPRESAVVSTFGLRRLFNGQQRSRHYGLDIDGAMGDPVAAIGAGTVALTGEFYFTGGTIVVDHGLSLFSLYFHLSAIDVALGQRVEKGQIIGKVGKSGRATGPHLHLSTKLEGISFDPDSLLKVDLGEGSVEPAPGTP